ncbi:hypothetical protein FC83_GL003093 [Agrilactobacillus composti DSM 18527 = JCM 14202]|uniref:Uncharacterized protein n=1 Tax=Agrilactobacillus composti DSM 18527 = JCM 14202 TaxID=1423734 RepID=X0PNX1_9LACO|nr:hypothetical protein [Agrilactobacillus composti]KRM33020.1 hypothetical protein FC83_GL003093 [Agrilactobacillus composti DSM 18527 = JCM 14202]GAF38636.1 hypothetical protein JCM14202_457 [Agrilactobacillus composti DSM 18527 = JCM 14202]
MTDSELTDKLLTKGYLTAADAPEIDNDEKGAALRDKLDKEIHNENKEPYLVHELFDYENGVIKGIIFNMDIIPTRDAAMDKLSEVSNNKEIKITQAAEKEINEIGNV